MGRRLGETAAARKRGLVRTAAAGILLPRKAGGADAADIAEQLLEEAALAAERRSLAVGRDRRSSPAPCRCAGPTRRCPSGRSGRSAPSASVTLRVAERDLVGVARHIIPVVRRELAGEASAGRAAFRPSPCCRRRAGSQLASCGSRTTPLCDVAGAQPASKHRRSNRRRLEHRKLHSSEPSHGTRLRRGLPPCLRASRASICGRRGATQARARSPTVLKRKGPMLSFLFRGLTADTATRRRAVRRA